MGWFANIFSGRATRQAARHRAALESRLSTALQRLADSRRLNLRYDAADDGPDDRKHWANADSLSAAAANNPGLRRKLRNRARYEVANNSYARGILSTLANDTVGRGPRLQLQTPDKQGNNRLELAFSEWVKEAQLAEKLRTMRTARAQDGEAFGLIVTNPRLTGPVKLDLRLIEAEQVADPLLTLATNNADGIRFDNAGNPVSYHVLRQHPGDAGSIATRGGGWHQGDWVDAGQVLHWYRTDRPGQVRGIPEIMPALPLFAQLRRYTLAVVGAAEIAAELAGILYTNSPAGGEAATGDPFDEIELVRRMMVTLPDGWEFKQFDAKQPTSTYAEFKKELLNEIARCLNMPFNVAAGNSSGYNYASGRLDHQGYHNAIRIDQSSVELVLLDRLLRAWLDEAALIPGLLPQAGPFAAWPHLWFWDGWEHVDPQIEANAQATRLQNHTTTLADEFARAGRDWETQLRQRAREVALMNELGLEIPSANGSPPAEAQPEEEPTEDVSE